jgi:protein SCO1/2
MKHAKTKLLLLLIAVLSIGAGTFAQSRESQSKVQHFKLAGTVKSVDTKQHKLLVQHGAIPGFMGAMTMAYPAAKAEDLGKIAAGDQIQADVVVSDTEMHLENIKVTGHAKGQETKDSQK